MPKHQHEFRDPIHDFIILRSDERNVVDTRAFQRLRNIHQLAFTYLVYPGATHRRFEHSLGVMELAGRIFDTLTLPDNRPRQLDIFPDQDQLTYWRQVVRLGALCHDLGHMPFSHAAEDLFPSGWHHEQLSVEVIRSQELRSVFGEAVPRVGPNDVAKVAVGPEKWPGGPGDFSLWDKLLTEIVTGDAFGADRIDYLLRDSHHSGVAYGRFDHHRLLLTLRVLPSLEDEAFPTIGIEKGGIHAAEAMQQARFFMFSQLYFHRVRRAYDLHLRDFLRDWLPDHVYPTDVDAHIALSDNDVLVAMSEADREPGAPGHEPARRILRRQHFRVLYDRRAEDAEIRLDAEHAIYDAAVKVFGDEHVRLDSNPKQPKPLSFTVKRDDGTLSSSVAESPILKQIPAASTAFVFVTPEKREEARRWLTDQRRRAILESQPPEEPS
jgi:hypothetical protein